MENGILINYTAAAEWKMRMVFIGATSKMTTGMDMEHWNFLMEIYTPDNSSTKTRAGMESTDTYMAMCIMDSSNTIRKMAMDITGGQVAMNTTESGAMG